MYRVTKNNKNITIFILINRDNAILDDKKIQQKESPSIIIILFNQRCLFFEFFDTIFEKKLIDLLRAWYALDC